jgi:hypothetical protein
VKKKGYSWGMRSLLKQEKDVKMTKILPVNKKKKIKDTEKGS